MITIESLTFIGKNGVFILFKFLFSSPWSLIVVNEQGEVAEVQPESSLPARLRSMEMLANKAFDSYRQLYYDGGISSVYFWPVDEESGSFGSAILLKKAVEDAGDLVGASWDAIHVAEVEPSEDKAQFILRMTSTILLDLQGAFSGIDAFRLGGSLTRQLETTISAADDIALVAAIGKAVEEQEGRMRSNLQEIYFGKTHEVINELRPALPEGYLRNQADFAAEMSRKLRC